MTNRINIFYLIHEIAEQYQIKDDHIDPLLTMVKELFDKNEELAKRNDILTTELFQLTKRLTTATKSHDTTKQTQVTVKPKSSSNSSGILMIDQDDSTAIEHFPKLHEHKIYGKIAYCKALKPKEVRQLEYLCSLDYDICAYLSTKKRGVESADICHYLFMRGRHQIASTQNKLIRDALRRLYNKGFLQKHPHPYHGRKYLYTVTDKFYTCDFLVSILKATKSNPVHIVRFLQEHKSIDKKQLETLTIHEGETISVEAIKATIKMLLLTKLIRQKPNTQKYELADDFLK